jgi:hypothetical protein
VVRERQQPSQRLRTPGPESPRRQRVIRRDDDFIGKVNNASVAVNSDIDKQGKLNAESKKSFEAMDGMQKAQRMQAYIMKNRRKR